MIAQKTRLQSEVFYERSVNYLISSGKKHILNVFFSLKSDFELKSSQRVSLWNENLTTCQTL